MLKGSRTCIVGDRTRTLPIGEQLVYRFDVPIPLLWFQTETVVYCGEGRRFEWPTLSASQSSSKLIREVLGVVLVRFGGRAHHRERDASLTTSGSSRRES